MEEAMLLVAALEPGCSMPPGRGVYPEKGAGAPSPPADPPPPPPELFKGSPEFVKPVGFSVGHVL